MPFHLYRKRKRESPVNGEGFEYEILRERIPLAGYQRGLIYRSLMNSGQGDIRWHLSESDLLQTATKLYNLTSPSECAIVIDLKPNAEYLDFYEIKDIWGFSYESNYRPIALRLEPLCIKNPVRAERFKAFWCKNCSRKQVYEFLYLQGETWTWGMVGTVNGALLFPDARKFFFSKIKTLESFYAGKLTPAQVDYIRAEGQKRKRNRQSQESIAKEFGVSQAYVSQIMRFDRE